VSRVAAVVVTHGQPADARLFPALLPQVDEAVLVANTADAVGEVPDDVDVHLNATPAGFATNLNRGFAVTESEYVLSVNPDAIPHEGAVAVLREFLDADPRAGIAGPRMLYPDGRVQPSRRRFPTVFGTLVRRTPLRRAFNPYKLQRRHYHLGEEPSEPVQADWMLGGFLLLRRSMLDELGGLDEGFRLYGEDIDLCYRAAKAGWESWYVPDAVVEHAHQAVTDRKLLTRRTLWHWAGILRFVRKHPERLRALR
jgi:N-acetylglucosaminyl-diphospho-decaprenol L-rhamnosyltransferase